MEEADELYALAPEDFVAARNALAKRLRTEGRKDDAATVTALRRPSVAAWVLNQVARTEPALVITAIEAGAELRAASEGAGAGDPSGLRAATKAERQAGNEVVKAAAAHLGGRVDAQRSALLATLRVAALDAEVADQLERGVLSADQDQPGFGFEVDDSPTAPRPARPPKKAAVEQAAAKAERAAEKVRRKEQADRRRTADRLAREAARLVKAAEAVEAEAQQARAEADEAVKAAAAAERAVTPRS